jgi:tryptophan 2-monooxygenase
MSAPPGSFPARRHASARSCPRRPDRTDLQDRAYTPEDLIKVLKDPTASDNDLEDIQKIYWPQFIRGHDGTTLEAAVRFILTNAQQAGRLPRVMGLTSAQLLDWCVELFGRFGFGTGGFKPLYNISLVEMMRLVLWDYSNEYTFPPNLAPGNVDFIAQLYDRATRPSGNFRVTEVRARVSDVFLRDSPREAGIAFYDNTGFIRSATFSYAILALPHDAATALVNRLGYSPTPLNDPEIGDPGKTTHPGFAVLPGLLLSTQPQEGRDQCAGRHGHEHAAHDALVKDLLDDHQFSRQRTPGAAI